jgi:hypothetical protein
MNLKVSKYSLIKPFIFLYVFFITIYLEELFINGDQLHYRFFYEGIANLDFLEAYFFQIATLGTYEPGYFVVTYIFSNLLNLEKSIFVLTINLYLTYTILNWLEKYKVSIIVIFLLFVNFYLFVLFFSAERLKLALTFFLLSFTYYNHFIRNSFQLLYLFTHVQLILLFISRVFQSFLKEKNLIKLFLSLTMFILVIVLLKDHILMKIEHYLQTIDIVGTTKIVIFLFLSIYYRSSKLVEIIIVFTPLIIGALLFGSDRITILAYFIFIYYTIKIHNGLNLAIIITSIYFAIKGWFFIENILLFGDGFQRD